MKTPAPERAEGPRRLAAAGKALPGDEEPIPDIPYLKKAIRSVGRLDPAKRPALKALIRKRARELGALNEPGVKGTWAFQGANEVRAIEMTDGHKPYQFRHGWIPVGAGTDAKPSRDALKSMSAAEKKAYIKSGALPDRLKPGASPAAKPMEPKRDFMAPPVTKPALVSHMIEHHAGNKAGGRKVGPRNPTAAQLAAMHAEQHQARTDLGHTHGETKPPQEVFYHGSPRQMKPGDFIEPGHASPGVTRLQEGNQYTFMSRDPGEARFFDKSGGRGHLYKVVPEDRYEPDPHLHEGTSMRSPGRLRILSEVRPGQSHANDDSEAIELAMARMPAVRGPADVQMGRTGPGVITAMHKSSGMKLGTIKPKGAGWQATHADGTACPASGSQQGAVAGLIAYHNKMAAQKNAKQSAGAGAVQGYAGSRQETLDFAPVSSVTSGDGPRVTTAGTGKGSGPASSVSAEVAKVYARLVKKGMEPALAMAFAKRAAAMRAKSPAKAA